MIDTATACIGPRSARAPSWHARSDAYRKQTLEGLNLADAEFSGCDFWEAGFKGGSLCRADLKHAQFDRADRRPTNLGGLVITTLVQSFKGCTLSAKPAVALIAGLGMKVV